MEDLISRISDTVGIDPALAEKAVGMILGFLQQEADDGAVARMIEAIPGGPEFVAKHNSPAGGGLFGGLMGSGGVMALGQQLMGEGLGMSEITGVARETIAFAREHAGEQTVDEVVNSVPGLGQFV